MDPQVADFPEYSRVFLSNLVKNFELNGQVGIVMPKAISDTPEVEGCLKVKLDSGREVAVKPGNVQLAADQGVPPLVVPPSQEEVLQQVLAQTLGAASSAASP